MTERHLAVYYIVGPFGMASGSALNRKYDLYFTASPQYTHVSAQVNRVFVI